MSHGGFECGHGGWTPVKKIDSNKGQCGIDFLSIKCHDLLLKGIHNCNKELYNVICDESPYSKAKIGITTNNQNDCDSCDFRIRFGSEGEFDDSNTRGNETSRSGTDNGDKHIREIGYILIH